MPSARVMPLGRNAENILKTTLPTTATDESACVYLQEHPVWRVCVRPAVSHFDGNRNAIMQ